MALACVCYMLVGMGVISVVDRINMDVLGICFGLFLISISLFFLVFSQRIHLRANWLTATVCGVISGVFAGLFGVGGPVMGLYLVTVCDDHEEYLGNLEFIFAVGNVCNCITRVVRGIYTWELVPLSAVGIAAILAGSKIGARLSGRIDVVLLRKIVYVYVGVSGVMVLAQHLL